MKLCKTLLILSLVIISCSSDDDESNEEMDQTINTEFEINFSGEHIGNSSFDDINVLLSQQCLTLEFESLGGSFENDNIIIDFFKLQFGEVAGFQLNNPGEIYSYDGPSTPETLEPIYAYASINEAFYVATSVSVQIGSEPYEAEACTDFHAQLFSIAYSINLIDSGQQLPPIIISGTITDFPIEPFDCGC